MAQHNITTTSYHLKPQELPLSNIIPEPAAELVLDFLALNRKCYRCIANTRQGSRCKRKARGHFCSQHSNFYFNNGTPHYWSTYLYNLTLLLHGSVDGKLRRFKTPPQCKRCQHSWSNCSCHCFCLKCTPGRHLQIAEFYRYPLHGAYPEAEARKIIAIPCKRSGCYRNHPYNHHNCEYCIYRRPCHKIETQ